LEKEFKEEHRRELGRSKFINAKQSKSKAKVPFPGERLGMLKKEPCTRGPKISNFY
jgi:hypothetical protein